MSLPASIAKNTLIQIVGKTAGVFFSLLTVGLITRYLGQAGFGYYTTIFAFLQIFGILLDFGLQTSTIGLISQQGVDESKMLSSILSLRLLSSILFMALAPFIALFFPYPAIIKTGIAISALSFVFISLTGVLTCLFQKYLKMQYVAWADFLGKFLLFLLITIIVYAKGSFKSILLAIVLASFLHLVILFFHAKKITALKLIFDIKIYKKIILTTYPIAITIALNLVYFKSDILILSLFRSPEEVGLYGAPYKVLEVLINLIYLFLGLLLPIMASSYAKKEEGKLKSITQYGFNAISILALPMIFGTLILGRQIMTLIAGDAFVLSGEILKILIFATAAIFFASLFGYVIIAAGLQKKMIKFYLVNAIVSLILYLILIPPYGYWAAAYLTVFTEAFILVTAFWVMKKHIGFTPHMDIFWKSCAASLAMSIPLYFMKGIHVLVAVAAGALIYFIVMYLIGGMKEWKRDE